MPLVSQPKKNEKRDDNDKWTKKNKLFAKT